MSYLRMSFYERMEIFKGLYALKLKPSKIAEKLNRKPSTITREIKKGLEGGTYNPYVAELDHQRQRYNQRPKLKINDQVWSEIKPKLEIRWSPNQICKYLGQTGAGCVSPKTIYNYVNFHMKGELKKLALRDLRLKGKKRRSPNSSDGRGTLKEITLIDQRPKEIDSRNVPGHWEGDLIIGKGHKSAILVTVERKTRYIQLDLLTKYDAFTVRKKIESRFKKLEPHLRKSITLDQGRENAQHKELSENMNMAVYFCHPSSPWEKGTCENTNYLIRDMLGDVTDFRELNQYQVSRVAKLLNERPRETLNFNSPAKEFAFLR